MLDTAALSPDSINTISLLLDDVQFISSNLVSLSTFLNDSLSKVNSNATLLSTSCHIAYESEDVKCNAIPVNLKSTFTHDGVSIVLLVHHHYSWLQSS